jgi:glycine dehydrogenase subunit 2
MGIDVMHFNLHKTFSTPHGGGGPGAGPVGVKEVLAPYLPVPVVRELAGGEGFELSDDLPHTIGRLHANFGNVGVMVRAFTYILSLGADGLRRCAEMAVLNANYLLARLRDTYHVPYDRQVMHECVVSDRNLRDSGVTTLDVAKRLIDYGFHPPTIYFPLIVHGALMIEPTESESPEELERLLEALLAIDQEARQNPDLVRDAPHRTRHSRLDETRAARNPVLRWQPELSSD